MTVSDVPGADPAPGDEGSAIVEFVFLAVLLLLPLVYVLLAVFSVQGSAYGLTSAAREAGRAYATARADGDGSARALRAAEIALADHGISLADAHPVITCDRRPCLSPGSRITVRLHRRVPLPFLGLHSPASIGVSAEHIEVVDRHRAFG
jgi:Flp pilus assembly protein TadG